MPSAAQIAFVSSPSTSRWKKTRPPCGGSRPRHRSNASQKAAAFERRLGIAPTRGRRDPVAGVVEERVEPRIVGGLLPGRGEQLAVAHEAALGIGDLEAEGST
jgi:hypothetical protein